MKVPRRYRRMHRRPWRVPLSSKRHKGYKRWLLAHGKLSPNFSIDEAGSKAGANCPPARIPYSMLADAQEHAFRLERVRHDCGDKPMSPLSWYRSPCHNAEVGGATLSKHKEAHATDWSDDTRSRLGPARFDSAMRKVFAKGGIGTVRATNAVRHVDNGPTRRWYY